MLEAKKPGGRLPAGGLSMIRVRASGRGGSGVVPYGGPVGGVIRITPVLGPGRIRAGIRTGTLAPALRSPPEGVTACALRPEPGTFVAEPPRNCP